VIIKKKERIMEEKAKYRAEIEAKLTQFGETLNELKTKQELRNETRPTLPLDTTASKHEAVAAKLRDLESSDDEQGKQLRSEIDTLMSDIDSDLRKALVHFA
jgi:lambda repressor-like predicted transcriptional regulator